MTYAGGGKVVLSALTDNVRPTPLVLWAHSKPQLFFSLENGNPGNSHIPQTGIPVL